MKFSIQYYFEFLSLLISIIYVGKLRKSFLIAFMPYLLVVLCVEITAKYLYVTFGYNTVVIYNLMNLFCHLFYAFLFYRFAFSRSYRQVIVILISSYTLLSLGYYLVNSFDYFNNYIIAIGGIIQVFFACLHFYEYLQDDRHVSQRHYSAGLIIASGVLIFYSGIAICFSLYNYILVNNLRLFNVPLYNLIPRYLSVLLYPMISLAIIIWKKPVKTSF